VGVFWDMLYLSGLVIGSPLLAYRMFTSQKYREGLPEKLGYVPRRTGEDGCIWIHGVSVGEVIAARKLIDTIQAEWDDVELLLTATTNTGHGVACRNHPALSVHYFPIDFSFVVRRAFERYRPSLVVLMELELWPNFLMEATRLDVPVVVVNGRISEKSYRIYKRVWPFLRPSLESIECYAVQTQTYAQRLYRLGIPPEKVEVTGNMKYDAVKASVPENPAAERAALGIGARELVFTGGSTHPGEEEAVIEAWRAAENASGKPVRLIVVPRHPERIDDVVALLKNKGLRVIRKSRITGKLKKGWAIVGDTMGEMMRIYSASDIVFVGGSLIPHGGQNMLEPVACRKATLWGPYTHNFTETVEQLAGAHGGITVKTAEQLAAQVARLAADADARAHLAGNGYAVLDQKLGATARNVSLLRAALDKHKRT